METDTIRQKLSDRFAADLPDFYKRRIIFWHDEEQSFIEKIDEIAIPGVKVLKLTGTNNFEAKKLLTEDDILSNYLVYDPTTHDDIKDDWLLDIELYSEEFRADLMSMRMDELGIPAIMPLRNAMKMYSKFFDNQARVAKLKALGSTYASAVQLHLDIMSVLTNAEKNTAPDIIRAVLSGDPEDEENEALTAIGKFGNTGIFWSMVEKYTGYHHTEDSRLIALASHIMLTALSMTVKESFFHGLEKYVSEAHQSNCYALMHEWLHAEGSGRCLYELTRSVERFMELPERFAGMEPCDLLAAEIFPCINECILSRYLSEITDGIVKADDILNTVEKRRTLKWYKGVHLYYDGIYEIARMQKFYQEHIMGFHTAKYRDLWKAYHEQYYVMDTCYRKFHTAFGESLKQSNLRLEDAFKGAADYVDGVYQNWYLKDLAAEWTTLIRDNLEDNGCLDNIDYQGDFYKHYVQPILSGGKNTRVFVIISDALRFEVAAELAEKLTRETRGKVTISAMQSVLPSVTKYGMAALLPHQSLSLDANGNPLTDGWSTVGTDARMKVLIYNGVTAAAFTYKKFLSMKDSERKELIDGKQVVYIYHNSIDTTGEALPTEDKVFEACETAIAEIRNLVHVLNKYTNILITSDHGFLYTYKPLTVSDKIEKDYVSGTILEADRRYILADENATGQFLLNIPMTGFGSKNRIMVPQDNIRFKTGGGANYVHGGVSLQEMTVPVIVFKNMRADSKDFVEVTTAKVDLISSGRKISNTIFSLNFYQKEPVGGKVAAGQYEVFFTDAAGKLISDAHTIIADKTSDNESDRVFHVRFALKGSGFKKTDDYYLTMLDKNGNGVPEKITFTINIAFTDDFDF